MKKAEKEPAAATKGKNSGSYSYQTQGMSLGMCFGAALGAAFGNMAGDMGIGMCFGVVIGMLLGMAYGRMKDQQMNEMVRTIKDIIEDASAEEEEAMVTIVLTDQEGKEEQIRMAKRLVNESGLEVGKQVTLAEDKEIKLLENNERPNP